MAPNQGQFADESLEAPFDDQAVLLDESPETPPPEEPPAEHQEERRGNREYGRLQSLNSVLPLVWSDNMPGPHLRTAVRAAIRRYHDGQSSPICVTLVGAVAQLRVMETGEFLFQLLKPTPFDISSEEYPWKSR